MIDYREILRLHAMKQSQSTLRGVIHCSDHTIRTASEATAEKKGVSWPLDADVTNADLERLLFPDKYKNTCANIEPDYQYIHRELAKSGVTLTLLWEKYCRKCYEAGKTPYMSAQFRNKYRKWACITKATICIQHKPKMLLKSIGLAIRSLCMILLQANRA